MHDVLELFITVSIGLMLGLLIMWGPLVEMDKKELSKPKPEPESPPIPSAREYNASLLDDWDKRLLDAVIQDGGMVHGPFLPKDEKEEVVKARDVFMQAGAINDLFRSLYHTQEERDDADDYLKFLYDSNPLHRHIGRERSVQTFQQWMNQHYPFTAEDLQKGIPIEQHFYDNYEYDMKKRREGK